ncbi:MAG: hypothetical protein HYW86_00595 [Candidatus Roizmanbacteria bacterium]|nr:MAG: hypothetical protein HYW86_00595 [Candidatus Roizmanbacteria bacterium]
MFPIKKILSVLFLIIGIIFLPSSTLAAVSFDLIPPSGQLTRGQEIQFTVNIDTGTGSITSTQVGASYQTQYLQYLSVTPGDAVSQLDVQDLGGGKILMTGSNPSGFKGKGIFAYINFKIIAQAPGSTELCTLFAPSTTPTSAPTAVPTIPAGATVAPTQLPRSGNTATAYGGTLIGIAALAISSYLFLSLRRNHPQKKHHQPYHPKKQP